LKGVVIIDEVQYKPDLFPVLRVLVDKEDLKFLVLGGASKALIKQSSETLAGRIGYVEMTPFQFSEVKEAERLWLQGGFPLSYLADTTSSSFLWRQNYIKTFLERDIPNLGFRYLLCSLEDFG
jgi:predicted AAA+ superfamily ATPase